MILQTALLAVGAASMLLGSAAGAGDYSGERERSRPSYVTPTPDYEPYHPVPAESKSYADDDRPRYDGPSHGRTGPHHKPLGPLGLGPGPLPLSYPHQLGSHQRLLPHGSVIGYLAYPQPLLHGGGVGVGVGGYSPLGLHDSPALLPSAAFSHLAFAPPAPLAYPQHQPQPAYPQHQPPYQPRPAAAGTGYSGQQYSAAGSSPSQHNYN